MSTSTADPSSLLSYLDAARYVVLSLRQFRRVFISTGSLPIVWVSVRRPRIRLSDLDAYLKTKTAKFGSPGTHE
jgi:hypothetical protein